MSVSLTNDTADFFVPDGSAGDQALERTTHLGVGAHADDLEVMALDGILTCFGREDRWFTGITMTDGTGCARSGPYSDYDDQQIRAVRRKEQRKAAFIGEYSSVVQLDYESSRVRNADARGPQSDLCTLIHKTSPTVLYTHNPADKHSTHIGVVSTVLRALRELPANDRPESVYGCEIWRDLDWLPDDQKVVFDVSDRENLSTALLQVFDSQITGGKRYDQAAVGRRRANATFLESHDVDDATQLIFGMDLSPLVDDPEKSLVELVTSRINDFSEHVQHLLDQCL